MLRLSAHLGFQFTEWPLEARFAAARRAGFSLVEHPSPYELPAERVAALCRESDLTFVQMALPAGDPKRGEKGIACLPGREQEFRNGIARGLDYAQQVGSRYVHVMSGVVPDGVPWPRAWDTYIENLQRACAAAAGAGLPVLVEPIGVGTIADYLVDHPDLFFRAAQEVAPAHLSMLFDTFHSANVGVDPAAFLRQHHGVIAHLHVADTPGRHEPGTGRIDFPEFFRAVAEVGYQGAIGLEYVPTRSTEEALGWTSRIEGAACP